MFLIGYIQAFHFSRDISPASPHATHVLTWPETLETEEVISELDSFYSQGANGPVPIVLAISFVTQKAKGATADELGKFQAKLRSLSEQFK
ncbi:MAG: hypothetical protein JWQ49_917 [Edaphobacter sp.]|nr:hypothetical protein [Edaphobacter sp.]